MNFECENSNVKGNRSPICIPKQNVAQEHRLDKLRS